MIEPLTVRRTDEPLDDGEQEVFSFRARGLVCTVRRWAWRSQKSLQDGMPCGPTRALLWLWGNRGNCSRVKTTKEQAFTVSGRKWQDNLWGSKIGQRKVLDARQETASDWINKQDGAGGFLIVKGEEYSLTYRVTERVK